MKARRVNATFTIAEDSPNLGLVFKIGNKISRWEELTPLEQRKMLNGWSGMYLLFFRHLKEEDDESEM